MDGTMMNIEMIITYPAEGEKCLVMRDCNVLCRKTSDFLHTLLLKNHHSEQVHLEDL